MDYQVNIQNKHNSLLFYYIAYNSMRQYCGLPLALSFNDLRSTMDLSIIQRLASVYA
jgi:hypothetical protein